MLGDHGRTYCLRADIGVPDLGLETHQRWSERVFVGNLYVHSKCAALVWCIWRPKELATQMCEVIALTSGLYNDLGVLVILYVGDLLCDTPVAIGSHGGSRDEAKKSCLSSDRQR